MAKSEYRTIPDDTDKMPSGVPYIIGNEAAERFSYYGMRSILVIYMTQFLLDGSGAKAVMSEADSKFWYHLFIASVYFFPLIGAVIADAFWGKYKTIMLLSLVYCLGNFALAFDSTRVGLYVGMLLISIGSGGIKPCVSANVGDQFGAKNQHLLPKVFGWFYFSINVGSTFSMLIVPELMDKSGPRLAFAIPGVLMCVATLVFWMGRHKFVHVPPAGAAFVKETFSMKGLQSIGKVTVIFAFVAVFFSLYDQSSSAWVLQAERMDRHFLGKTWLSSQIQTVNPILILLYIPLFTYVIYPAINKVFPLTPLRKISIGFFVTVFSFLVPAWIDMQLDAGHKLNVIWQVLAFMILSAAEVMVSITCLEFAYSQAPKNMKSLIMAIFLASMAAGNAFTSLVNLFIQNPDKTSKLTGPQYYIFFAILMFVTSVVFVFFAKRYKEETHLASEGTSAA
jgi:POT family proton-dependent oligopeptide transporter